MEPLKYCFLIDDDSDDQEIFLEALNRINPALICEVECDSETALNRLRTSTKLPDIIFLDINMPKMDGFELIAELKLDSRLTHIPVVFYSTTIDERQLRKGESLGASGFITKATSYADLYNVLKVYLEKEFLHNESSKIP